METFNQLIMVAVMILVVLIFILISIYLYLNFKSKKKEEENKKSSKGDSQEQQGKGYNKQSIHKFMEFDKIEDNMIVQKNGTKYIMAIQCQGVNYDLMSEMEKIAVEEGFIQFLNTIRSRVQIYVQTKTVNLEDSINNYKQRTEDLERDLEKNKMQYNQMQRLGQDSGEDAEKLRYEIIRQENLLEYGFDIIRYTEKMSLNRNVLQKQYYIIIPYFTSELGNEEFSTEEARSIAFSELYTRAQGMIRSLYSCGVTGTIMNSYDLVDLLYTAYNRDDAEVYGLNKALMAGYDELYSTGEDVIEKRKERLDKEIEQKALDLAVKKVEEVQNGYKEPYKEEDLDELIKQRAKRILEENEETIGTETMIDAIESIEMEEKGVVSA